MAGALVQAAQERSDRPSGSTAVSRIAFIR